MAVTRADVQRVAAKYLSGPATITIVSSAAAAEPTAPPSGGAEASLGD